MNSHAVFITDNLFFTKFSSFLTYLSASLSGLILIILGSLSFVDLTYYKLEAKSPGVIAALLTN